MHIVCIYVRIRLCLTLTSNHSISLSLSLSLATFNEKENLFLFPHLFFSFIVLCFFCFSKDCIQNCYNFCKESVITNKSFFFVCKNLRSDTKEVAAMGGPPIEQNKFKRFCKKYFLEGRRHFIILLIIYF
jgi:hypothetical protein